MHPLITLCLLVQALEEVEAKTVAGILSLVERERTGVDVNRALLRSLLRMLSALQVTLRWLFRVILSTFNVFSTAGPICRSYNARNFVLFREMSHFLLRYVT